MSLKFYVSTDGNDSWTGTVKDPAGADGPFATISRARDEIRSNIAKGLNQDVTVEIRGGTFRIEDTIVFGLDDSPPSPYTVTYKAYENESPVLSGAEEITGWQLVEDLLPGVPEAGRGKIWAAPLDSRWLRTLYHGHRRLRRGCEPGFLPRMALTRNEWEAQRGEISKHEILFPDGTMEGRMDRWDVEAVVRPMWPWVVNILPVSSIDTERKIAKTDVPATYPVSQLQFGTEEERECCWVENSPQGLDRPGSWIHDNRAGMLYLWPDEDSLENGIPHQILAPKITELIRIEGDSDAENPVRGIRIEGLTFVHGEREVWDSDDAGLQHDWDLYDKANALVRLRGAEGCEVRGCHFKASGGGAVRLDLLCRDNLVTQNLIEDMGGTGILLSGFGPGVKDLNRRNRVIDNHVHHCGRVFWHAPAIFLWQSGENIVSNNLIHHLSYNAVVISGVRPHDFKDKDKRECTRTIRWDEVGDAREWHEILPFMHGRNNIFENNEIHHAMQRLADGNAIYVSGCGEGNIIRRNYIHDMGEKTNAQAAIRTDGWQRGTLITENVIYDCACAVMRKNYNHVENNIIVNAREDIGSIAFRHFPDDEITQGSRVMRNICCQQIGPTNFYEVREARPRRSGVFTKPEHCMCDFNLFYDMNDSNAGTEFIERMRTEGLESHSVSADPLLADPNKGSITPKQGSPAYGLGFKPIDMGMIGLTDDYPFER